MGSKFTFPASFKAKPAIAATASAAVDSNNNALTHLSQPPTPKLGPERTSFAGKGMGALLG